MAPTILVVGATGNTGKSVIRTLPELLESKNTKYRVLGLTRSLDNPVSKKLAKLPNVEMHEKDWTTIDAEWLKEQEVVRVFIAPHAMPHQFVDESEFHIALLEAGIQYVVRISTTTKFIGPTSHVYYGRSHWAIEHLLSQPEFKNLQWTSLQPNIFTATGLSSLVEWIKNYQKTGKQETLKVRLDADVPVAMINPEDVGRIGAHLLALDDPSPHNQAKYIISGPENVTGKQQVEAVEQIIGTKVQDVKYRDTSFIDDLASTGTYPKKLFSSFLVGAEIRWKGLLSLAESPTDKAIIDLAPPKITVAESLKNMLEE